MITLTIKCISKSIRGDIQGKQSLEVDKQLAELKVITHNLGASRGYNEMARVLTGSGTIRCRLTTHMPGRRLGRVECAPLLYLATESPFCITFFTQFDDEYFVNNSTHQTN